MSKNVAEKYNFKVEDKGKQFNVRLANGRVIATSGCVRATVFFGAYYNVCKFHVLDCPVPLILGMQFLARVQPKIDFRKKQVVVTKKGLRYNLPTC